jgi:hypothetical protein
VPSPTRPNRHEVIVPFRVLPGSEVAGLWVTRSRYDLGTRRMPGPSGISSSARTQGRDSLGDPLMGFDAPSRSISKPPPRVSRPRAPLLGFRRPFNARGGESPRPVPVARSRLPGGARGSAGGSHSASYGAARGFPNLSAASSSPRRPAIFRRVAFVGFCPSGNCSFHKAPTARRRRHALLTLLPSSWPYPRPRRGRSRALRPVPRSFRSKSLIVYRAFVLVEIDPHHRSMINDSMTDLSLLGFCLLMV